MGAGSRVWRAAWGGFAAVWLAVTAGVFAEDAADLEIVVDAKTVVGEISPWIYGVNFADWSKVPGATISRQGGNRMTAWNWENNASNAGADWHHQNDAHLSNSETPGEVARAFVAPALERGRSVIVTVPTIGYVAADKKGDGDVSQTPDHLNTRFYKSLPKKNAPFAYPPDRTDTVVYQDEFVWWLSQAFPAGRRNGGRIFYALDNEPDIWSSTHARIHPQPVTYAEMVQRTRDYAGAIKDVEPQAVVFGFVSYGFGGFTTLQGARDGNGRNFSDFFLDSMREAEQEQGRRLVDVLDLHWYPEVRPNGRRITEQTTDPESVRARVQAPRSLWDPAFREKSWIADDVLKAPIRLIPRLREQIERHYPGTKLAFTEYDYGGTQHISGAIAEADVLGIFGREQVFAATYWGGGEFTWAALACYRDYDGKGGTFGDQALKASSSNVADVSVYASRFSKGRDDVVMVLINRSEQERRCRLNVESFPFQRLWLYGLEGDRPVVTAIGAIEGGPGTILSLPAMSVTTAVLRR